MNYWEECIKEAFEDAGITASKEQIDTVVSWVDGAHENYGMAHGYDAIPNPLRSELDETKRALEKERSKVQCEQCNGRGRIISYGPHHSSNSQCLKCRGEGKVAS